LGRREIVVGLDLGDLLEGAHAEGPQLADSGSRADAQAVQTEGGVGGDLELCLDGVVVNPG